MGSVAWHSGAALIIASGFTALPASAAPFFMGLGDLPGGSFSSEAAAISADGQVVVGTGSTATGWQAFRWTLSGGMVGLGALAGDTQSGASGVSADGSTVVGWSNPAPPGQFGDEKEAFLWTSQDGMIGLGDLSGGSFYSSASAVSADGSVVVGRGFAEASDAAFRWTAQDGMVALADLAGGSTGGDATAISADGSVIVGWGRSTSMEAARWENGGLPTGLGYLAGGFGSVALDVSADGSMVVGGDSDEAVLWQNGSVLGLGFLPGDDWSTAHGVSVDGSVVVGSGNTGAFIWDPVHGSRELRQVLIDEYGLDLTGWELSDAYDVSDDGRTIVGMALNPSGFQEAFIAVMDVGEPRALALVSFAICLVAIRLRETSNLA